MMESTTGRDAMNFEQLQRARERLYEASQDARDHDVESRLEEFEEAKAEVVGIIEELRGAYSQNESTFDAAFLQEIRTAKLYARLYKAEDIENPESEMRRLAVFIARKKFLSSRGLKEASLRRGDRRHRIARCYNCTRKVDNEFDLECTACGWIVCDCGACGCGR